MAQATLSPHSQIPSSVASKLRGLRFRINIWLFIDGLSRVLAATAVLLFLFFLLDYNLSRWGDFDFSLRLGTLVIGCLFVGYLIYRGLILPFSSRVSDDALVLAVEKHYGKETGESLISAVQFSRMSNEVELQGVSPTLVRATIDRGTEAANRLPFGTLIDTRWLFVNLAIFAIGAMLLGIYAYGATAFRGKEYADPKSEQAQFFIGENSYSKQLLGIAFDREILLKDTPWPQDAYFLLNVGDDDGQIIVPRGDNLELQVQISPDSKYTAEEIDELQIHVVGPAGRFSEKFEIVKKTRRSVDGDTDTEPTEGVVTADSETQEAEEDDLKIDHFLFSMTNVTEEFEFQIDASPMRGASRWYQVKLVDRPDIETLQLTAALPEYAGGKQIKLPSGAGPHHILAGSSLQIDGKANKPLSRAVIRIGDISREMKLDGSDEFSASVSAEEFGKDFTSGAVSMDLFDTENLLLPGSAQPGPLKSKRPTKFSLRIKADRAPDVVAKLNNISGMVTPRAVIPYDCLIKDEYAVTAVKLSYQWKHEENEADTGEGEQTIDSVASQLGQSTIRFRESFSLEPLKIPAGSGLSFHISATDNNDISGPGEGKSTVFLLRVVTDAELREDVIRRQAEQRQDFERLVKEHEDQQTETAVLQAEMRQTSEMTPQQRQKLLELQKDHKLLETNIGSIAKRMESIATEMQNNKLDDSESKLLQKLRDNVIQPMQELAQGDINETIKQLDNVRTASEDRQQRDQAIDNAIAQQERNDEKMREILKNMAKTEGYQEAVNLFYEILKEEEKIRKLTEEERERLREEIFGDGGKKED